MSCYGQPSFLFFGSHSLLSSTGVHQGDPLGPLLFCITIHSILERLQNTLPFNSWYLDDGTICVPTPDLLETLLTFLHQEFAAVGVSLNFKKCVMWGPGLQTDSSLTPSIPPALQLHESFRHIATQPFIPTTSLRVLGVPVEHPDSSSFRGSFLARSVDTLEQTCDLLGQLGHPPWQLPILTKCLDACKLMFILRSTNTSGAGTILHRASQILQNALGDILGVHSLQEHIWLNAQLPLTLGGLGIKDPVIIAPMARLAGTLTFLSHSAFFGFHPTTPPDFLSTCTSLLQWTGPQFEPLSSWIARPPIPSSIAAIHKQQKWWTTLIQSRIRESVITSSTLRDRCRLALQKDPHAAAWLTTIPHKALPDLLTGPEFRIALKWWLGLPLCDPTHITTCPACHSTCDVFGDHWLCCSSSLITRRHNSLRNKLAHCLQSFGLSVQTEVVIGTRDRPADIALLHYDSRPLALDITISHPLRPSASRDSDAQQSFLTSKETRKNTKYSLLCNREGWLFQPLAFHPWGGFGPLTNKFLQTTIRRIAGDCYGRARSHLISSFWQTIGQGIAKGVAQQLQESLLACPTGATLPPTLYQLAPNNPHQTDATGNLLQPLPYSPSSAAQTPLLPPDQGKNRLPKIPSWCQHHAWDTGEPAPPHRQGRSGPGGRTKPNQPAPQSAKNYPLSLSQIIQGTNHLGAEKQRPLKVTEPYF